MVESGERLANVRSFDFTDFFVSVLRLAALELLVSSSEEGRIFDSAKKLFRRAQDEDEDDFLLVSMLPGPGPILAVRRRYAAAYAIVISTDSSGASSRLMYEGMTCL